MDTPKLIIIGILALSLGAGTAIFVDHTGSAPATETGKQFGAISSPDLPWPYIAYGGVAHVAARTDSLTQATTTVCALQSPASTSTLQFASIRFVVSSTTASIVTLAKAATAYATTTVLGVGSPGAGAQATITASTTLASADPNRDGALVFSPNTYFVVGMQGGVGTFSPTGTCEAEWITD